ncbi:TonB-dependent receptor [Actinobacillus equuli]|nr:TonB-dependent receptor [Actinobacillus equuli]
MALSLLLLISNTLSASEETLDMITVEGNTPDTKGNLLGDGLNINEKW